MHNGEMQKKLMDLAKSSNIKHSEQISQMREDVEVARNKVERM